jgi:hypothetical protein
VMDRRRSPAEVLISVEMTSGLIGTCSVAAMYESREDVEEASRGVNRNLEQRDARGSMILRDRDQ